MRERLAAARPTSSSSFSNDHLLNWPINNTPEYTVGIGALHVGARPTGTTSGWQLPKYRIPVTPRSRYLVNEGARRRWRWPYLRQMEFDDGSRADAYSTRPRSSRSCR